MSAAAGLGVQRLLHTLEQLGACEAACLFVHDHGGVNFGQVWSACTRPEWLLWLVARVIPPAERGPVIEWLSRLADLLEVGPGCRVPDARVASALVTIGRYSACGMHTFADNCNDVLLEVKGALTLQRSDIDPVLCSLIRLRFDADAVVFWLMTLCDLSFAADMVSA